jgi:hypothetical protein
MIYSALWRALPGPTVLKAVQVLVLVALAVAVLFLWVFPRIAPSMPFNENTVGTALPAGSPVGAHGIPFGAHGVEVGRGAA